LHVHQTGNATTPLDLHSKRLVGWSIAEHTRTELVTDALKSAAGVRDGNLSGAIFHSDTDAQAGFGTIRQNRIDPSREAPSGNQV
jgi:transposase InsO family protein